MTASERFALRERFPKGVCFIDSLTIIDSDGGYQFITAEPFQLVGLGLQRRALIPLLKRGADWDELFAWLEDPETGGLIVELDRRKLLVERLEPWRQGAQERQLSWLAHFLPTAAEAAQQKLRSLHAFVVGCGGTGGVVVQHLASIGLGALTLIDDDVVELSNFNRQLPFRRSDIGSSKAHALRDHVSERHPECRVEAKRARVGSEEDLLEMIGGAPPSVIFCCADTPAGKINAYVARAAARLNIPSVFGSVGVLDGAVGPILAGSGPSAAAFAASMDELGSVAERIVGKVAMGASFSPVNTLVAAWMVLEWSKFVLSLGDCQILNQSVVFDGRDGTSRVEATW